MAKKCLYKVRAWMPVTACGKRLPIDFKNSDIFGQIYSKNVKEGNFGYGSKSVTVPANYPKEAGDKVLSKLEDVFGDFPEAKPYVEYGGGIKNDEPLRKLGIELQHFENENRERNYKKKTPANRVYEVKYFDIDNLQEPVYVMVNWANRGIALSFNEIYKMINKGVLPKRFKQFPDLIPQNIYNSYFRREHIFYRDIKIPSKYESINYGGEKLTPKVEARIVEGLLNHEEEHARGFQLTRYLLDEIKAKELFPEKTHFWSYHPEADGTKSHFACRFHRLTYFWENNSLYARNVFIGTLPELEDHLREEVQTEIREHASKISSLSTFSEEATKNLRSWPIK